MLFTDFLIVCVLKFIKTNRCYLVCPGYIQTNLGVNALKGDGSSRNEVDAALDKGMPADLFAKK